MPKFYREAILAARCITEPTSKAQIGSLETWTEVAEALNGLNPAGRCHAIYSDWLIQLHEPGGDVQIQIRDLLLGQGALAANYLGEMAQNADDSGATSLLVALDGDWLLVANNGRPISSLNLLGLCRFFVHSNGEVVGLTPETIGKFGIGFKSCHRVADEVFVWSWGAKEEFGFRLPICQSGGDAASSEPANLALLTEQLNKVGRQLKNLRQSRDLGHCTPEVLKEHTEILPPTLVERLKQFKTAHSEKGVWFALHLHEHGRKEAEKRIMEQVDAVYELCPLFLNHLRNVTLQDRSLRLALGNAIGDNVGETEARRVRLEVTNSNGTIRNDRLIILSSSTDKTWKLALPTDSEFRIKRPNADQFSLRSGGGYAFLPLPSLIWPWHVHFHLNAPTNLARSDWNPADAEDTHAHICDAAAKLAKWLGENATLWHQTWQPADILTKDSSDIAPGSSARVFADAYQTSLSATESLRTLWGTFTSPDNAVGLCLEPGQSVTDAWIKIAGFVPAAVQKQFPLVLLHGGAVHLDLPILTTETAKRIFTALREINHDAVFWQAYIQAVLGTDAKTVSGFSRNDLIEDALGPVPLNRPADASISIETASESRFAVRLTDEWHEHFRHMSVNWLGPNWPLASQTVFEIRLSQMLRSLSTAAETPTGWDEVSRMTEEDFRLAGDAFWSAQRSECPTALVDAVIRSIWVESGHGWFSLAETWLGSEPIAMMRGMVRALERRPGELNDQRRRRMSEALTPWGLGQGYENIIKDRIKDLATNEFYRRINEDNPKNPNKLRMLILADNWKPERLPLAWQIQVADSAKKAIGKRFADDGYDQQRGKKLLVGDGALSCVLSWLPDYVEAPVWLEPDAIRWIETQGIFRDLNLLPISLNELNQDEKAELGKALLAGFRHWPQPPINDAHVKAMSELFLGVTGNWTVGYPGGADKRLNEHCVWIQPPNPDAANTPQECIISGSDRRDLNGGTFLPEILTQFPELRAKCFQISDLLPELLAPDDDDAASLVEAETPETLAQNPWFQRLRQLCPRMKLVSLPGNRTIKWKRGDMELVLPKVAFGICKLGEVEVIFISDVNRKVTPESGARYLPVLVAYTQVAPEDRAIANAVRRNRGLRRVYHDNRAKIKARLVQAHATDMGYEAQHVMRELLQNAESAYASRQDELLPDQPTFQVTAQPDSQGATWLVEVTHFGRAFNEQDKTGTDRSDDIERLCALSALQNRTDEEVGRFNRGFKSIFQVTDEVHVTSGAYSFKVEDLLLLDPSEPTPTEECRDLATRFQFKIDADKKPSLFRETAGRENAFKDVELVFLRYVSLVEVDVNGQTEHRFEIERGKPQEGWHEVKVVETKGSQNRDASFLVCHKRENSERRIAVAIGIDSDGLPVPMSDDVRFFYRTFPLQQKSSWFPFLINADDFLTDHGRAGLSPKQENETLIIHGLEMSLCLVRNKIESSGGNIEQWLSWITVLERRRLAEGASTLQSQKRSFEDAIAQFDGWILKHLPDGTRLRPSSEFVFPSRLLRRLHEMHEWQNEFAIESASWIVQEVAEVLGAFGGIPQATQTLQHQVAKLIGEGVDKEMLRRNLEKIANLECAQDIISIQEVEIALGLVARHQVVQFRELLELLPDDVLSPFEEEEPGEEIQTADIVEGWEQSAALNAFSLAGWMGDIVFNSDDLGSDLDQRTTLMSPDTERGKECWYRLLCLGSLLGARALPQTVRGFWQRQLARRGIFSAEGNRELANLLDEISHRTFTDLDATGENAEMWRRVFYDFQKLRLFVFEDDLPGAFLDHLNDCEEWDAPINFLKNGFRKNEKRWTGSVGQSMTVPLFWIMRELRRIQVIDNDVFNPSCYYLNGPARRILCGLPGFDEADRRAYRFEQLLELSRRCHQLLHRDFPNHFDLPLQWYAANTPR